VAISGPVLQKFLGRYPFSSTKVMPRHFLISPVNCERNCETRAGTEKFSTRSVPHLFSEHQKKVRIDPSQKLLSMLGMYAEHYSEGIAAGDESWFQYSAYSDSMFADSRESAVPRIWQDLCGEKPLIANFFPFTRLLVLETLPKGTRPNQDYFIHAIFPRLSHE
jgi:hypothetical protein